MLGDQSPDVKLGSVVYGRVSGYPWWPAVIAKCPTTHQWTKGGKFWVYFFNDTAGAWLKASQIRSFDPYNHGLCREHNSSVPKFRRYQDRISKAVSMAETHVARSSKSLHITGLPSTSSNLLTKTSKSDVASVDAVATAQQDAAVMVVKHCSKRKHPLTRKRESSIPGDPSLTHQYSAENENHEKPNAGSEARPKRKRMRSIRYLEHENLPESKAPQKSHGNPNSKQQPYPVMVSNETVIQHVTREHDGDHPDALTESQVKPRRRSSRLRRIPDVLSTSRPSGKRSSRKRVRSYPQDSFEKTLEARVKSAVRESSVSVGSLDHDQMFEREEPAIVPKYQGGNKTKKSNGRDGTYHAKDPLTKHMYVAELKEVARKSNGAVPWPTSGIRSVRGVRSLVGVRSGLVKEVDTLDDCTDTEERPERERKVNMGSLEVAAEDLVEYAIQGYCSTSSDSKDDTPESRSIAFSNGDLVSSILNRLSNLEKDVALLNRRAASEEQATLGEDATAAGVKSAVEALAAASAAFAKARDYNTNVIRRSVEVLWPDGQFPLAGADGDLLRTVAKSLILASCKRRQVEVAKVVNKTYGGQTPGRQTQKRSRSEHRLYPKCGISDSVVELDN